MDWKTLFEQESNKAYFKSLMAYLQKQRQSETVYPAEADVFRVFDTPSDKVNVVILGQDPYHQPGQAIGYSFAVNRDQALPKSLINIFKELKHDLGIVNEHGDLSVWAKQGVFLLNTILTVREGEPLSHAAQGWETFTDRVLSVLGARKDPIIFILWGKKAQMKKRLIAPHHFILESSHPSPLGAYRGFWNSKPFSKTNQLLIRLGKTPIDWSNNV